MRRFTPFILVLIITLCGVGQAVAGPEEKARSTREAAAQAAPVQAKTARKPARQPAAPKGPDTLSVQPGTVLTLCCGSLDPHSMAGSNCAYMHTGQGCGGYILACPEGTKETVKQNGDGYCKEGG